MQQLMYLTNLNDWTRGYRWPIIRKPALEVSMSKWPVWDNWHLEWQHVLMGHLQIKHFYSDEQETEWKDVSNNTVLYTVMHTL